MTKLIKVGLVFLLAFFSFAISSANVHALNTVNIYFFYDQACTHCYQEGLYLDQLEIDNENIVVNRYEITGNPENNLLFEQIKSVFSSPTALAPFTVIGGMALQGYNDQTAIDIQTLIERYSANDYIDVFQKMMAGEDISESDFDTIDISSRVIPLIGEVNIKTVSLFLVSIIIGFVDGFNPCAMWVLIFLITMLINQQNRKKAWLLGTVFLFTSALMYFLIMAAWLNIAIQFTTVVWIRIIIGLFSFGFGAYQLIKFMKSIRKKEIGCEVTDQQQKRRLIDKIKKIVLEQKLLIALLGVMALAISVNLVELACSAGLPLLFTQILAYNDLPAISYYGYILLYILFFLLDDLIVFTIAMVTFKVTGISNKYSRISTIVGGIIMLIIGFLLIFFPEIIMFNFF